MRTCLLVLALCTWLPAQDKPKKTENVSIESQGQVRVSPDGKQVIEGYVKIELPGVFLLTADQSEYDSKRQTIVARGNVKIDIQTKLGLVEITAAEVHYYLPDRSGYFVDVTAQFDTAFYFVGERLEVLEGGDRFVIERGVVTACNQPVPQWAIDIHRAKVKREGYAVLRGARFRIKRLPMIYIPYLILPAMQERTTGLLLPQTGSSQRNGWFYHQPFYWAPRQDMDFTLAPTWYADAGISLDLEARYTPRDHISGTFRGTWFDDKVLRDLTLNGEAPMEDGKPIDPDRFRATWEHIQDLGKGTLTLDVDAGSDFSVDRNYLQDTELTRVREYYYRARYDRDFGRNLLSVHLDREERILAEGEAVQEISRLPELRFFQPNVHLGSKFYMRNYGYATLYDFEDLGPDNRTDELLRLGLDTEISRTQNWSRFLHTRWGVGYQGGWFKTDIEDTRKTIGGAYTFIETVGPRLQRDYKLKGRRLVHYVDAVVTLKYGSQDDDPFYDAVLFDDLDIHIQEQTDGFRSNWKLNSRFFTGPRGRIRPFLEVEMNQDVTLEDDGEANRPINTRFRLLNFQGFHTNGIFEYNPDNRTLDTLAVYGSVNRGEWVGYGGYVKRRAENSADIEQESVIGITQWRLPSWSSRFKLALDYDFTTEDFKSQEITYGYEGQCVGFAITYLRSPFDVARASGSGDFLRLNLSLRNLTELGTRF